MPSGAGVTRADLHVKVVDDDVVERAKAAGLDALVYRRSRPSASGLNPEAVHQRLRAALCASPVQFEEKQTDQQQSDPVGAGRYRRLVRGSSVENRSQTRGEKENEHAVVGDEFEQHHEQERDPDDHQQTTALGDRHELDETAEGSSRASVHTSLGPLSEIYLRSVPGSTGGLPHQPMGAFGGVTKGCRPRVQTQAFKR
jgi:hypothetical protein